MQAFVQHTGVAAPLPIVNVDTDAIIAAAHVATPSKTGLGKYLFHRWRYREDGSEIGDFVLNQPEFRGASILVSRANFGCGSSREHAVWSLADFGLRCVVAPSFASILHENCIKNGILPAVVAEPVAESLLAQLAAPGPRTMTVNLETCTLVAPDGQVHAFEIDSTRRHSLLNGLDAIATALQHEAEIAAYQEQDRQRRPWVWNRAGPPTV